MINRISSVILIKELLGIDENQIKENTKTK